MFKKRWVKVVGICFGVFLVVMIVILNFLSSIVASGVRNFGPSVMKVPIELEDVQVRLLMGTAKIKGLVIGNPEGFQTDNLCSLGEMSMNMRVGSVLSDTIEIDTILIDAPHFTYEGSLMGRSNLGTLLKTLESEDDPAEEEDAEVAEEDDEGKMIRVNEIVVRDAQVKLSVKGLQGKALPIKIKELRITELGDDNGVTAAELSNIVLVSIFKAVKDTLINSGESYGLSPKDIAGLTGGAVIKAGSTAVDATKKAAGGIGRLFKKDKAEAEPTE